MRLSVRLGVQVTLSLGFSWANINAPDTSEDEVLFQHLIPISSQTDSRNIYC